MTTPNVLWIITDDAMRSTLSKMPRVNFRLVGPGTKFSKAYCAVPLCGPSRASYLTSMYPHNHKCHSNMTHPPFVSQGLDEDTVATRMQAGGYATGYFGKYMNGHNQDPPYVAPGWTRWVALVDADRKMNIDGRIELKDNNRAADFFAGNQCAGFIRNHASVPWFAIFAPSAPHDPYTPSAEHAHDYDTAKWTPESFNENSMGDKPTWMQGSPRQDQDKMNTVYEGKLEELQDVDDMVEGILDALAETDQMDDTFIFFLSDNGYLLGEHRLFKKEQAYEESAGIPFVVRGPGVPEGAVVSPLVCTVDLMPTTLEIAGLDPDAGRALDGRSMLAGLHGDWTDWRQRMLVEYTHPDRGWAMLCEGSTRFIDHVGRPGGEWEFYDLATDPSQMVSKNSTDISGWRSLLNDFRAASGEEFRALEAEPPA